MLKKTSQKGFTIVELLIVIVVIGILAALVLNTYNGVQAKARDTERQTDTKAISTQLEAAHAEEGGYPTTTQMSAANFAVTLPGIDAGALSAPGQGYSLITTGAAANKDQYGYVPSGCEADPFSCDSFVLTYFKEDGGVQTINSLN